MRQLGLDLMIVAVFLKTVSPVVVHAMTGSGPGAGWGFILSVLYLSLRAGQAVIKSI